MNWLKSKKDYDKVTTSDALDASFSIDDDDGPELSMEELSQMHNELLREATDAISSTDSSTQWLREERQQAAVKVRALTEDETALAMGGGEPPRRGFCFALLRRLLRLCPCCG